MDIDKVKQLLDVVAEERIEELRFTDGGGTIRIVRVDDGAAAKGPLDPSRSISAAAVAETGQALKPAADPALSSEAKPTPPSHQVIAPMVGTFYRSATTDGPPFVEVGARVEIGTPLCVIEAMKIMNEIEADRAGIVTQVLCEAGCAVERGQPLFRIE